MKTWLGLLILAPVLALGATNIENFNEEVKAFVAEGSTAERESKSILQRKFDDWKIPADQQSQLVSAFAKQNYKVHLDKDCSRYAEKLLGKDKGFRKDLVDQAEAAANFLVQVHARMLGNPTSIFKISEIAICTDPVLVDSPTLQYDRFLSKLSLQVGPRLKLVGRFPFIRDNLHTVNAKEIREKWNDGNQWEKEGSVIVDAIEKKKNPIRKYWRFIDPIGDVRVALREIVRKEGVTKALSLDAADEKLKKWRDKLLSPKATEDMGIATLTALGEVKKDMNARDIEKSQIGLVNVENFHQINVDLVAGDVKTFQQEVKVPDRAITRVKQVGLVNVSTGDDVNVFVALLVAPGTFERATKKAVE